MADNKKYYYLKLKDNFFDSEEMIILESMPDGYMYSNILLKLYLKSLKNDGRLMYKNYLPYTPSILAPLVRHPIGVVEKALKTFQQLGLVEVLDNGAIYMMDIQNFIGESSTEADRKRDYRRRIEEEKNTASLRSGTNVQINVGQMSRQMSDECPDKSTPEIRDKSIEIRDKSNISCSSGDERPTTINAHKANEKAATEMFERLWARYPRKQGKGKVSKSQKMKLYKLGENQLSQALDRFNVAMAGRDMQYIPYGSTWFNSGYVDYLGENYTPQSHKKSVKPSDRSQMTHYRSQEEAASIDKWMASIEE